MSRYFLSCANSICYSGYGAVFIGKKIVKDQSVGVRNVSLTVAYRFYLIANSILGYIFLCGGRISDSDHQEFLSCRDLFYSYINKNGCSFCKDIVLAEKIFEYFDHSEYQDLLHFERDLAELSSLTVIFSESPGSIAELGSFSVLNTIQERLLVVMHQDDTHQESFIWRGPVSF